MSFFGKVPALAVVVLAGTGAALAQTPSTTGVAPADGWSNNQPSLAGQALPSPQDAAAHNDAVAERDRLPILAHTFNFTPDQRQQIRAALAEEKGRTSDVAIVAGTEIPPSIETSPMPDALARQMPWVKPYRFAKLDNRIVIVDPNMPVVVAIIE